jgi:hypothetical protein
MTQIKESTQVLEEDVNLQNLFGTSTEGLINTEPEKERMFQAPGKDEKEFLDNPDLKDKKQVTEEKKVETVISAEEIDDTLSLEQEEELKDKGGRPKVSKDLMVSTLNKLFEKGSLVPFEDDKPLEDYTQEDLEELIEANLHNQESNLRGKTTKEFFEALPPEMQYAAKYIADGGNDLKSLFRVLSHVEEVKELDPSTDSERIAYKYLSATTKFNNEEIEEQIQLWKDQNILEQKAGNFKPKLDELTEQEVAKKLKQQEVLKRKQEEQAEIYIENVYNALAPGDLNGIKLDKKVQNILYTGLVNMNYPSVTGNQTSLLGHLLEKYQFVEPNHALVAEALYLLADPKGYREKVLSLGEKIATEKTVRSLKTEESLKKGGSAVITNDDDNKRNLKKQTIQKPSKNFFRRD